ncbi:patatin-like phospholipase family protein [Hydrogenovibrio sp. SC-1]|uniref:patatin-like phospholipase family protein n=1 Tax=Hydrogenovibrio sp. SC-1 TaxID=2065820 RepID=UPI001E4888BA|nr:patatin-like phospholipase family protein [Hydrogenovibrio sp. SC-1]
MSERDVVTQSNKTVSLVLGSGGARGMAHIGVIRWLETHGYQIQSISGSSIGALVGGIYAAGKLGAFEEWMLKMDKVDILGLLDLAWQRNGLVKGEKLMKSLSELIGDVQIKELPIAFTAVATDIARQREVWLQSGRLLDAIRASISLPLFFTPYPLNGVDLMDGGILNPVPIAPTFSDNTDLIVAVSLSGDIELQEPTSAEHDDQASFLQQFNQWMQSLRSPQTLADMRPKGLYEIADLAFDAMQNTIARQKLAAYPADEMIEIASNACGMMEFDRTQEMIALGYEVADKNFRDKLK